MLMLKLTLVSNQPSFTQIWNWKLFSLPGFEHDYLFWILYQLQLVQVTVGIFNCRVAFLEYMFCFWLLNSSLSVCLLFGKAHRQLIASLLYNICYVCVLVVCVCVTIDSVWNVNTRASIKRLLFCLTLLNRPYLGMATCFGSFGYQQVGWRAASSN